MIDNTKNKKLKITLDAISALSLLFILVIAPIWGYLEPNISGTDDKLTLSIKLMMVNAPLAIFGGIWLALRYSTAIYRKYPFISSSWFIRLSPFVFAFLFLLIHIILRNFFGA